MALTSPEGHPLQLYVQQVKTIFFQLTFDQKDTLAPWLTPEMIESGHITGL